MTVNTRDQVRMSVEADLPQVGEKYRDRRPVSPRSRIRRACVRPAPRPRIKASADTGVAASADAGVEAATHAGVAATSNPRVEAATHAGVCATSDAGIRPTSDTRVRATSNTCVQAASDTCVQAASDTGIPIPRPPIRIYPVSHEQQSCSSV